MPDEIRVQGQQPNGNGFAVDLKEKKLFLTGPNVALLLLILLIGFIAWQRTGTVDKSIKAGQDQLAGTEDRFQKRFDQLFSRIDKLIDDLGAQDLLLTANNTKVTSGQHELRVHLDASHTSQNTLLHSQTQAIEQRVTTLEKYIEGWFTEIGTRLEWLDHNVANPERRMPLRAPSPHEERQKERGR